MFKRKADVTVNHKQQYYGMIPLTAFNRVGSPANIDPTPSKHPPYFMLNSPYKLHIIHKGSIRKLPRFGL